MKRLDLTTAVSFLLLDILSIAGGFTFSYLFRKSTFISTQYFDGVMPIHENFEFFALKAVLLFIVIAAHQGLYKISDLFEADKTLIKITTSTCYFAATILAWFFIKRVFFFSRFVLISGILLSFTFLLLHRGIVWLITRSLFKKGYGRKNVLVLGWNDIAGQLISRLEMNPRYNLLGVLSKSDRSVIPNRLGSEQDLSKILQDNAVHEVIHIEMTDGDEAHQIMDLCHDHHVEYHLIPDLCARHLHNIQINTFIHFPMLRFGRSRLHGWGRILKRTFDVIASGAGIIVLSPLFLLVALLIKLDSKGPVFYVSKRISMGKTFTFLKFRSMYTELCVGEKYGGDKASELREQLVKENNERSETPMFKMGDDPRITRLGKFLRSSSLDELPQLFNVFIGSMSLVGPRPHLPEEVDQYTRKHRKVLAIKPGITGLPQINGRSDLHFDKEVELDTHYIENWSFWTDIVILCKTFYVVLFKRGSY